MGSHASSAFPTLAEQLADRPFRDERVPEGELVAVFEQPMDTTEGLSIIPGGAVIVALRDEALSVSIAGRSGATMPPIPATLDGLLTVVRANDGDVLLVSEADRLTHRVLACLEAALAHDSACSTVSVDSDSRPVAKGLPPPGIARPMAGIVLVRRDDLLLATDEAELTGRFVAGPVSRSGGHRIVSELLSLLERPGFVHRAYGVDGAVSPGRTSAGQRLNRSRFRVLIDGSCLAHRLSGTQVQTLALIGALAHAGADMAVMRPSELHPTVIPAVDRLATGVSFVGTRDVGRPDVLHRPDQIASLHQLADSLLIAERLVVTHQDMIWDRTLAYHDIAGAGDYRRANAAALHFADGVGFFSLHAAIDAASEGILELDRATVVPLGVDHLHGRCVQEAAARPLAGRPYLLVVGSSFWHKNRVFALRVLGWLAEERGWEGGLVFIGADSGRTSSAPAEALFLSRHSSLDGRVVDLGHVAEGEQLALYRDAELVLFPSLYEGFGLIPFEAAALGTACVYTRRAAMGELLPPSGALPSFDLRLAGSFVFDLLESREARARIVDEISAVAAGLTWDRTAAGYLAVYERALARPRRPAGDLLAADRELTRLAPREAVLLDVYRRRRGVRIALDSALRGGMAFLGGTRRLSERAVPDR